MIGGQKLEAVAYDNKGSPQESLVQVQKAIDAGVRFITQGNGSGAAIAISEFVTKYNERNPGKEVLYFNYAAVDPSLTNDKCSFWHLRWDASSDIKMAALTNFMKDQKDIKKVYIIGQDYSFGHSVPYRRQRHAQGQAARHPDRRRRTAPAAEDHRLLALHRQDQGLGRRLGDHRQLGQRHVAAAQGRRRCRA